MALRYTVGKLNCYMHLLNTALLEVKILKISTSKLLRIALRNTLVMLYPTLLIPLEANLKKK